MSFKRAIVAQISDLQDGEMRQVCVEDTPVLLSKVEGKFYATGAHCIHYGAPLADGALSGERLVCPWHNACYDVTTGDQLRPPGLDDLPCYEVRVEGKDIIVSVPEEPQSSRTPAMAKRNLKADSRTFVILGAGSAGIHAAETLRKAGFQGRIIMITADDQLSYDRTVLSKRYLKGNLSEETIQLRSPEFYSDHAIELWTGKLVTQVIAVEREITFADDSTLHYDALLLATGGTARQLQVPGADLPNIFTLRNPDDAEDIVQTAQDATQAVVIGSSFIGMETAARLAQQGLSVTVVSPESVPFEKTLGQELGKMFQRLHEQHGVAFKLGTKAARFEGNNQVESVVLDNGDRCPADLVIVGIGVKPATAILRDIRLDPEDDSVSTDEYLRVTNGLYAAGDIAQFPDHRTGEMTRIEHWQLAAQHGRIAARNMAGESVKFTGLPFFWTAQFDVKLRYIGHAERWDEVIINGNLNDQTFLAFYIQGDRVLAVAGSNRDSEIAAISELMRLNQMPPIDRIRQGSINWLEAIRRGAAQAIA